MNHTLDALSIIHNSLQNEVDGYDAQVATADDGRNDTIAQARMAGTMAIDTSINELLQIKEDIRTMPWPELKKKYQIA